MDALLDIIEQFNCDNADYFGDDDIYDSDEWEDRLLARLETGCSIAEQEGRFDPDAKGPLLVVKSVSERYSRRNRATPRVKKVRLIPRNNGPQ